MSLKTFEIKYSIKFKEDKTQTTYASGVFDAMLNGGWSRTEKTNSKGSLKTKTLKVKHDGSSLSNSLAIDYIVQKDKDILSGKAGSSTVSIINIDEK